MPPVPKRSRTSGMKINAIRDWPRSRDKNKVRRFLRLRTYDRRFANGFGDIAAAVHRLTDFKSPFNWTTECEAVFKKLKHALCYSPILFYPQTSGCSSWTQIPTKNIWISTVLLQVQNKE